MSRKLGNQAESRGCEYLLQKGYVIVERNFYSRFGEIDIIAKKGDHYHFFEVKSGKNFNPIYNITPKKLQKIIKTIEFYISQKKITSSYSIDALIISDSVEIYENITF